MQSIVLGDVEQELVGRQRADFHGAVGGGRDTLSTGLRSSAPDTTACRRTR